jgi:integrase/recombinase XerD
MKQAKTLTDKQLKAVLAHCATRRHPARDRAIVLFSHLAGLRAKEIALLTIDNVLGEQGIRDEFVLSGEQTKGRKARRVFVSSRLRAELAAYLKQAKLRKGVGRCSNPKRALRSRPTPCASC